MTADDLLTTAAWVDAEAVTAARRVGSTITGVTVRVVGQPLTHPIRTANYLAGELFHTVVRVETAGGAAGYGHTFAFSRARAEIIRLMVEDIASRLVGAADTADPAGTWKGMLDDIAFLGHSGVALIAVSAIDVGVWDALGRLADRPVHDLLGGSAADLSCYASDRLWLGEDADELRADARDCVEAGFLAVKVRIGSGEAAVDLARVEAVREVLPGSVALMADANQAWSRAQAAEMAEKLRPAGLRWLEEPVPAADIVGLAALCTSAGIPIASGESWYGPDQAVPALEAARLAVFMPDLQRMGGATGWLIAARAAADRGMEVSPHLFPEIQASLMCGLGARGPVEYVPWYRPLFDVAPDPTAGVLRPLDRPGFGTTPAPGLFD